MDNNFISIDLVSSDDEADFVPTENVEHSDDSIEDKGLEAANYEASETESKNKMAVEARKGKEVKEPEKLAPVSESAQEVDVEKSLQELFEKATVKLNFVIDRNDCVVRSTNSFVVKSNSSLFYSQNIKKPKKIEAVLVTEYSVPNFRMPNQNVALPCICNREEKKQIYHYVPPITLQFKCNKKEKIEEENREKEPVEEPNKSPSVANKSDGEIVFVEKAAEIIDQETRAEELYKKLLLDDEPSENPSVTIKSPGFESPNTAISSSSTSISKENKITEHFADEVFPVEKVFDDCPLPVAGASTTISPDSQVEAAERGAPLKCQEGLAFANIESKSSDDDDSDFLPTDLAEDSDDSIEDEGILKTDGKRKRQGKRAVKDRKAKKLRKIQLKEDEKEMSVDDKINQEKHAEELYRKFLVEVEEESKNPSVASRSPGFGSQHTTPQSSSSSSLPKEKKIITEYYDFAGEVIPVEKVVETLLPVAGSSTSKKEDAKPSGPPKHRGGLADVIAYIDQKKKQMTTLRKSSLDWETFKKRNNIEDELSQHNKGRDGYLQKKAFLERSDLRSFEVEKNLRLKKKK